jgi:hypothetical protein
MVKPWTRSTRWGAFRSASERGCGMHATPGSAAAASGSLWTAVQPPVSSERRWLAGPLAARHAPPSAHVVARVPSSAVRSGAMSMPIEHNGANVGMLRCGDAHVHAMQVRRNRRQWPHSSRYHTRSLNVSSHLLFTHSLSDLAFIARLRPRPRFPPLTASYQEAVLGALYTRSLSRIGVRTHACPPSPI